MLEKELKVLKYVVKKKNEYLNEVINKNHTRVSKCSILSEKARKLGDHLSKNFDVKQHTAYFHLLALKHYCRSILLAPAESDQLVVAYESLSDFLFHVGYYGRCIKSISRALEISQSHRLKTKLLLRKTECFEKMGITVNEENDIDQISESLPSTFCSLFSSECEDHSFHVKNNFDSVKIKCSKKSGTCLKTTKEFQPGDIIFVERPYCLSNTLQTHEINCNYCLNSAWSGVPCEFCDWAIFCSEECKKKAYDEYHDLECCLIPSMQIPNQFSYMNLSIRTIITSIKEAGGISLLRHQLMAVDKHSEPSLDFHQEGNYFKNLINFIYSSNSKFHIDCNVKKEALITMSFLIALVQRTELVENFSYKDIDDFLQNDDLIFIGSLILKLSILIRSKNFGFQLCNRTKACNFRNTFEKCQEVSCCSNGICLAPLTSLIPQSKYPNVAKCFTENNEIVIFAVQPIKEGDQIFITESPKFHVMSTELQEKLLMEYKETNFLKQPILESWLCFTNFSKPEEESFFDKGIELEKLISQDFSEIINVFLQFMITNNVDQIFKKLDVYKLSKAIQDFLQKLPQASKSYLIYSLIQSLEMAVSCVYGMKPTLLDNCNLESNEEKKL